MYLITKDKGICFLRFCQYKYDEHFLLTDDQNIHQLNNK
jgi:hypothetical protein